VAEKCLETQGVPKRYWSAKLTKENTAFLGSEDVQSGLSGVYFIGDSGVGKSYLSVAWMTYMLSNGYVCRYINWSDFMVQLRMDVKEYSRLKAEALQGDVIVIDDFDATNQYMYEITYNFINALYNSAKILIMNSIELPTQSKLAMRIGEMTKQVMVVRK
jgi:DNA replication protein DnaC